MDRPNSPIRPADKDRRGSCWRGGIKRLRPRDALPPTMLHSRAIGRIAVSTVPTDDFAKRLCRLQNARARFAAWRCSSPSSPLAALRPRPWRTLAAPSPCMARPRCRTISPRSPMSIPTRRKAAGCRRRARHVRQPQSAHRPRSRGAPIHGYVVESLMARGYDEPFTLYGLLARTVKPMPRAATSPSRSIPRRNFPTAHQ